MKIELPDLPVQNSVWNIDYTDWIDIPRPELHLSLEKPEIEVFKGKTADADVNVQSSIGFEPLVKIFYNNNNLNDLLNIHANESVFNISSDGKKMIKLVIKPEENMESAYTKYLYTAMHHSICKITLNQMLPH